LLFQSGGKILISAIQPPLEIITVVYSIFLPLLKMTKRIVALSVLFYLSSSVARSAPIWHMVNCNTTSQGDCHLLQDNSVYTLIDSGQPQIAEKILVPYLLFRNIHEIEHFFISHPHTDHYGGLEPLKAAGIRVKNIYYNALPSDVSDFNYKPEIFRSLLEAYEAGGTKLYDIRAGFSLKLPNSQIYVLEAKKERQGDVNDYSLQMVWDAGGYRTLFTGDLNKKLGTELANKKEYQADILKAPHHGVTGIAPNEFFDNVAPSMLMIPSNKELWYHSRGAQVRSWAIENWEQRNTHVCSNGFNGNVRLSFHQNFIDIDPQTPNTTCPKKKWYLEPKDKPQLFRAHISTVPVINMLLED
jgi:competence protein ComEC